MKLLSFEDYLAWKKKRQQNQKLLEVKYVNLLCLKVRTLKDFLPDIKEVF